MDLDLHLDPHDVVCLDHVIEIAMFGSSFLEDGFGCGVVFVDVDCLVFDVLFKIVDCLDCCSELVCCDLSLS